MSELTTQEKVIAMKEGIEFLAVLYGLNLTVYDGKIGFVDQQQKKIVAVWNPEFKMKGGETNGQQQV